MQLTSVVAMHWVRFGIFSVSSKEKAKFSAQSSHLLKKMLFSLVAWQFSIARHSEIMLLMYYGANPGRQAAQKMEGLTARSADFY